MTFVLKYAGLSRAPLKFAGLSPGDRLEARFDNGHHAAEVLEVSTDRTRKEAPVKVRITIDTWVGMDCLRAGQYVEGCFKAPGSLPKQSSEMFLATRVQAWYRGYKARKTMKHDVKCNAMLLSKTSDYRRNQAAASIASIVTKHDVADGTLAKHFGEEWRGLKMTEAMLKKTEEEYELQKEASRLLKMKEIYSRDSRRRHPEAQVRETVEWFVKTLSRRKGQTGTVTLENPYEGVSFSDQAGDSRWWKASFHAHGPRGFELHGFYSYLGVIRKMAKNGYRIVCMVEHEAFIEFTEQEQKELMEATKVGGECEGLVVMSGAEGRASGWGQHITLVSGHPDFCLATHPNTLMNEMSGTTVAVTSTEDDETEIEAWRFWEDSAFENVDFLEIFNAWGRYFKPNKYWLADRKWGTILDKGCRVWALADDDSMLDFPGVKNSRMAREEFFEKKGLDNEIGDCGIGWNMVFMGPEHKGTSKEETAGIVVDDMYDQCGMETRQRAIDSFNKGRFYCSTGVTFTNIQVEGNKITVETDSADTMIASITNIPVFKIVKGSKISFEVPLHATYARVTATRGEGDALDGKQYAWTQPFWVRVDGKPASYDPRHRRTNAELSAWHKYMPAAHKVAMMGQKEEALANIAARRATAKAAKSEKTETKKLTGYMADLDSDAQADLALNEALKLWGSVTTMSCGYFGDEGPPMTLQEATVHQVHRLAEMGNVDKDSVLLDLGCGTGASSILLAKKYGCRVVGVDVSGQVIRNARCALSRAQSGLESRVHFFQGTIKDVVEKHMQFFEGTLFTHLWSTLTLFLLPRAERDEALGVFANISTGTSRLVISDFLCSNSHTSASSAEAFYKPLNLERLWTPKECHMKVESSGFEFDDVMDNISWHAEKTFGLMRENARENKLADLERNLEGAAQAVRKKDAVWYNYTATRKS